MKRNKAHSHPVGRRLPLNLPLELADGRILLVRKGGGKHMVARQKQARRSDPIEIGEVVETVPDKGSTRALLKAVRRTKKDIHFEILGSLEPVEK